MSQLSATAVRAVAGRGVIGNMILIAADVTSTNDTVAKLAGLDAPHGTVVVAREQRAGRGRRGRRWWHDDDNGVAMSVLLRPTLPPARAPELVHVAALAVDEAVRKLGVQSRIKWPNDIVVGEGQLTRKLAGILVESAVRGDRIEHAAVGVGINVNTPRSDFDPALAASATSLLEERGKQVDRNAVAGVICARLDHWLTRHAAEGLDGLLDELRARSATLGTEVELSVDGEQVRGRAVDLDQRGALLVETAAGARHAVFEPPG